MGEVVETLVGKMERLDVLPEDVKCEVEFKKLKGKPLGEETLCE